MKEKGFYPLPPVPEEPKVPETEPPQSGYVDTGPPLPEHYDVDMVRMLVQDPSHIYIFWELSGKGSKRVQARARRMGFNAGRLALQITRLSDHTKSVQEIGSAPDWWLLAEPGVEYQAEVGFVFDDAFFTVVTSNRVQTPPITLAEPEAELPPSSEETERAAEVLKASGFEPVTVGQIRERVQGRRDLTPRERIFVEKLPTELKELVLGEQEKASPEMLRRIVWAMPRVLMVGSELVQVPQTLLEWLAWPGMPLEWPTSQTK